MMKLSDLKIGENAKIIAYNTSSKTMSRMFTMGLVIGSKICMKRKALFNGPIQIKIKNFYLAIRKSDADKIVVELC